MSMVLVHVGNVGDSYKSSPPRVEPHRFELSDLKISLSLTPPSKNLYLVQVLNREALRKLFEHRLSIPTANTPPLYTYLHFRSDAR